MNVSVLIQTHNEEKHIEECIKSARYLTDSIVVVDMKSTDNTSKIAKQNGATVISFTSYPFYVEPAREFGIKEIKTEWVMILDADERMTKNLAREIREKTDCNNKITHYKIPRKNIFGGKKWLKYGGWWPDEQIRLINLSAFKKWPTDIHSTPVISGDLGYLKEPFVHLFHGSISSMVEKTLIFEDIESELLYKNNKPVSVILFFRKFLGELWRRLFIKMGFLDGIIGIIECVYQAFSKTITYLFLYEKKEKSRPL